jgi:hypothetical protein
MNIIKEYLADVKGVEIFAIVSLVIFIVIFTLMVIHTFSIRKTEIRAFKNLPLEDDELINQNENQK